jgi:hypothetical protein
MLLRRVAVALPAFTLIIAAPASAATTAAGPSPTPLILELALAGAVVAGLALRRPAGRALAAIRRLADLPRTAAARARAQRAR